MNDILLTLETHLYDHLNMGALQRALQVQLPLVEKIGSVRASLLGMHTYHFALTENCSAIDRIIILLDEYRSEWPEALATEVRRCAHLRSTAANSDSWHTTYRSEAQHLLMLAAASTTSHEGLAERLRQYQIYACAHLLGNSGYPPFLKQAEIADLLSKETSEPAALFARQFCERQRKPELLARELAAHFAALD